MSSPPAQPSAEPSTSSLATRVAQRLQRAQPWSDGELALACVWIEALSPGLKRLHDFLEATMKGLAPPNPKARPWTEAELTAWLERDLRLTELLERALDQLLKGRSGDWWVTTRETADCGATREVLMKLVYRKLSADYDRYLPLMTELATTWERLGGLKPLDERLCKELDEAQASVTRELLRLCLSDLQLPRALDSAQVSAWLHAHRALREALYRAGWEDARGLLRPLSELCPKCGQLILAWATLKAREKRFEDVLKGAERVVKVGSHRSAERVQEALPRWRALLAPPPDPEPEPETALASPAEEEELRAQRAVRFGLSVQSGQGGSAQPEPKTAQTMLADPNQLALSQLKGLLAALPLAGGGQGAEHWEAPLALLRSFAQLGARPAHELASRAVLSEVIELVRDAQRQLSYASERYPEARELQAGRRSLALAERLLAQALHYAPLSAAHAAEPLTLAPPLPYGADGALGHAPTAMVNEISSLSLTDELSLNGQTGDSLSLAGDARVELTLDVPPDLQRAQALLKSGDFTQAEHCLLALLDQNPFDARAHNDLGVLNFQLHRFGDAKAHLILAIECEPSYEEAWDNLLELFTSLGQLHHALPLFRRFERDLKDLASYPRLKQLCERFAPEGYESMTPPPREEGQKGLRLPLTGSFFISPEAGEDPLEALSGEHPDIEQNAHVIAEAKARAQQEIAKHLRVDVQSLLEDWKRELYTPPARPRGIIPWLKERLGRAEEPAPLPPKIFDELSLNAQGLEEQLRELEEGPELIPTKALPIDQRRVRNVAFNMLCVPSGTFLMGSDPSVSSHTDHEHPRHRVVLSRPFQLAQMPVTQELYEAVMWINPSHNKAPGNPVVRVNWFDAARFCNALSELEGLPPAYRISSGARPEVAFLPDSHGYRLPTEAEWEYSARARQGYLFSGAQDVHQVAWVRSDELHTVGRKAPNPWGFHDMSGNVWEWCSDGLREYSDEPMLDPVGDQLSYMHTPGARVIRGGSWCFEADGARVSFRGRGAPGLRITSLGFRVARSV